MALSKSPLSKAAWARLYAASARAILSVLSALSAGLAAWPYAGGIPEISRRAGTMMRKERWNIMKKEFCEFGWRRQEPVRCPWCGRRQPRDGEKTNGAVDKSASTAPRAGLPPRPEGEAQAH